MEEFPTIEPIEEVMVVSVFDSPESALERDAEQFIKEEDDADEMLELPEYKKPSWLLIDFKPLPSRLIYAFLNSDVESPVIVSDKISEEETTNLIAILDISESTKYNTSE